MIEEDINTMCWWIPFRKTRNAFRNIIKQILKINDREVKVLTPPSYVLREPKDSDYVDFNIFNKSYKTLPNGIFDACSRGDWEPQTLNIYKKYINKDTLYLDIGSYVGVTAYIAHSLGCHNIVAIEAHPYTYNFFKRGIEKNNLSSEIKLFNFAVTDKDNSTTRFGCLGDDNALPSNSSLNHDLFEVDTITLSRFIKNNNLNNIGFVKIDIEGAEALVLDSLKELSQYSGVCVWFSIHPPFWNGDKAKIADNIINTLLPFEIRDADDELLSLDKLKMMMTTDEKYPSWGTQWGNFFEILLISK